MLLAGCERTPKDPFADLPGVRFEPYRVSGSTAAAIRESVNRQRGRGIDGASFDGATRWKVAWRWRGNGKGGCDLSTLEVSVDVVVRLPELDRTGVPEAVLRRWDRYYAALRSHEAWHARNALSRSGTIGPAIRSATCATANATGKAILHRIRTDDDRYDGTTDHGRRDGATFPGPAGG